jgi:hypothetical protein
MTKLIDLKYQNEKQMVKMIVALLKTCKGMEFDGHKAQVHFMETWGIYADHHIFVQIMDIMSRSNETTCTQGWGDTKYLIN